MSKQRTVEIGKVAIAADRPFALIAGPCAIESREHALMMAGELKALCGGLGIPLIYKSSFDKANRSSARTGRGLGMERGIEILAEVKQATGLPVLTDVHESWQCAPVAEVVDVLQIPAFLCRQTDLLKAAADTGRAINVKKGQFLAPWDMVRLAAKVESLGCERLLLCERGTSFGYNTLVTDMRGLPQMAATGWPVIFDATHSVQQPGGLGETSGGERQFVPVLARAAMAVGVAGVFIETHDNPDKAISDGPNMVPLRAMRGLLQQLQRFDALAKELPLPTF